jgi:Tol biopolymer transport system component/DNA-binding winged helix-turn-helix (wHTH) protein
MPFAYRFGDYLLDVRRHTLHCGAREIHLGERAFGVLRLLVENAGRAVTRHELIDAVWRDVVVSDDSLARAVSDLRKALQDDAAHARYIRTLHRQGYLFIAPVTPIIDAPDTDVLDEALPHPHRRSRLRSPLVLTALVLIVVAGGFGLRELGRTSALGPLPFTASAIKPAFAKSDNLLAVVAPDPDTGIHSLFLLRPDGGEPLQITRDVEVRGPSPEFAADDSHILFTTYHSDADSGMLPEVWMVPVPAGEPTLLVEKASAASSSPDGLGLVYAAVDASGTSVRVRHPNGRDVEIAASGFWPRWSPDGEWIAYTTSNPEGGNGTMHVVRPDGSDHRELTHVPSQVYGLCWMPDSSRVIYAGDEGGPMSLWSVGIDGRNQHPIMRGPGDSASPTVAADGRRLVFDFSHGRWYLSLAAEPGTRARRVLIEPGLQGAALSPDGKRIAIALGRAAQSPAVSLLDLDDMKRQALSGMAATDVAWMPDGEELLVAAPAPDGTSHWVWRLPLSGGLPQPVLRGTESWHAPRPSPDGTWIAAVRRAPAGPEELVVQPIDGGHLRTVARRPAIAAPRWSPDGKWLAWSGGWRPDEIGSGGVWICPVEGGDPRQLTVDGAWPAWERDGKHLLYARYLEHEGLWRVPLGGGSPRLVQRLEDEMDDLSLEGLDLGPSGGPALFILHGFIVELYALEPPVR